MKIKGMVPEFKDLYFKKIVPALKQRFEISNDLAVPKVLKVIVNTGLGSSKISVLKAIEVIQAISCQYPVICRAKKSVADFGIREGQEIGVKSTCRGDSMYLVLQRLLYGLLNNYSKFELLNAESINVGKGICSIAIGIRDTTIFHGVNMDTSGLTIGCSFTIVMQAKSRDECIGLLTSLGFPFNGIPYKYGEVR